MIWRIMKIVRGPPSNAKQGLIRWFLRLISWKGGGAPLDSHDGKHEFTILSLPEKKIFIPYHGPASTIGLCFVAMVFGGHFPSSSRIHQIFGEVFASPETRALEDVWRF